MHRIEGCQPEQGQSPPGAGAADTPAYQTRVHFTVEDLARTTFMCAPAPLVETVLSLVQVRRRIPPADNRWSNRGGPTLPETVRPVLELIPAFGYWPEFLDPAVADLEEGPELVRATPRTELRPS